jgi:hypothetical protein
VISKEIKKMIDESKEYAIQLITQFIPMLPRLAAYLAGIVLASVFMARARLPCILMLSAFLLLLISTVAQTMLSSLIIIMREVREWPISRWTLFMSLVSLLGGFIHAVAIGLLIGAVLVRLQEKGKQPQTRI